MEAPFLRAFSVFLMIFWSWRLRFSLGGGKSTSAGLLVEAGGCVAEARPSPAPIRPPVTPRRAILFSTSFRISLLGRPSSLAPAINPPRVPRPAPAAPHLSTFASSGDMPSATFSLADFCVACASSLRIRLSRLAAIAFLASCSIRNLFSMAPTSLRRSSAGSSRR